MAEMRQLVRMSESVRLVDSEVDEWLQGNRPNRSSYEVDRGHFQGRSGMPGRPGVKLEISPFREKRSSSEWNSKPKSPRRHPCRYLHAAEARTKRRLGAGTPDPMPSARGACDVTTLMGGIGDGCQLVSL